MTITQLDDEPLDDLHPLDLLERTVEANGWAFERAGRDELNLSVAGKWSDHHFNFSWREDLQSLHLSSAFDMRISEGVRRQNVADLLMLVNAKLWIGHFDLWPQDGTIIFRHAMIFPDAEASAAQCEALLNLALEACEHYYPAFQFVLWGGKTAEDADRRRGAGVRRPGVRAAVSILLVGAGRMGGALLKGWLERGVKSITVVEPKPSPELRKLARAKKITLFAAPSQVKHKPAACVVAIKPQVLKGEAAALAGFAQSGALMISIAAGTSVRGAGHGLGPEGAHHPRHAQHAGRHRPWHHRALCRQRHDRGGQEARRVAAVGAGRDRLGGQGRTDRQRHGGVGFRPCLSVPDGGSPDRSGRGGRPAARPGGKIRPRHGGGRGRACWRRTNRPPRPCAKPSPAPAAPRQRRCQC